MLPINNKRIFAFLSWVCLSLLLVVGCNQTTTPNLSSTASPASQSATLTISAAASLKDAMEAIKPLYAKENSNVKLTYNFGSSGALQQQIEQGAGVDIFISAATKQVDALQKKGLLLDGTRKDLLKNQIVLIAPQNSTVVADFKDLTKPSVKKIALGEPKSVPAGQYAQQVLTSSKIFGQIKSKAVYAKDVRQALNYVESGNADAGIVYLSDAKSTPKVKIVATAPENTHSPVVYPIAILKSTKNVDAAKNFVQFLSGNQAKTVFEKQGFTVTGS
ncbi:molybdate ABC transporter substrate-binding protein [Nostocaceae cyanobacterium CENA369]|uniref:Molybdate ABC transporter substrate-binding protein n=1 Tax=Dendronalium phyllosphericum CENA369 TaxID=1725256 RepID=A0A8J7I7H8_9NOST|nr:molybdate ABC transporter substrate-binding protein [Dendronalium phyllosphericum]MBH8574611.1 molybdate ABC transporter substrate-binding protein [Dendronalium phyllosphericum CENA369]